MKRKRTTVPELSSTNLRRVCFQLDELVELRTYDQVEAELPIDAEVDGILPTVKDMTVINPYASSTPLDRSDLYLQCCKVYRIEPHAQIAKQLRARGPKSANFEGPRTLELRNLDMTYQDTVALADCLGLPLTGKHLTEVIFDDCGLDDVSLQLLLSCLYGSAKLEALDVTNNPKLTQQGVRSLICFLCLSPQLQRFAWQGQQMDLNSVRLMSQVLKSSPMRALTELVISDSCFADEELEDLLQAARNAGVYGFGFAGTQLSHRGIGMIASLLTGPKALHFVDLARNDLSSSMSTFIDGLNETSPLISLDVPHCGLTSGAIEKLLRKLTILPNFRRLNLSGLDLRTVWPTLKSELPRMPIIRRLVLAQCDLKSQDIITLCEIIADLSISQLVLTGTRLDAPSMSALYAAVRVSKTLINLEIDIPKDAYGEKIGRRILAECIRNMETHEGRLELIDTDVHASVVIQHQKLSLSRQEINPHEELTHGAQGVAMALDQLLDTSDDTAKDLPRDMFERARYMRQKIEPTLSEPLEELQKRRLHLVVETLDQVISRFSRMYPECVDPSDHYETPPQPDSDIYEHSGRQALPELSSRRRDSNTMAKSRKLETEEGEVMKLALRVTDRLNILKSASASASKTPSRGSSRGELADAKEAHMLEQMNAADVDGAALKQKLYALQASGYNMARPLGTEIH